MKILCPKCNASVDTEADPEYAGNEPDFAFCPTCDNIVSLKVDEYSVVNELPPVVASESSEKELVKASLPPEEAKCPACHRKLKKMPSRKTKCPHCEQFIYVRTRPQDRKKVLATEEEAEKIEEDWLIASGNRELYSIAEDEIRKERETFREKFGKEPKENDIKWGLLNKHLLEDAINFNWGLYRCTLLEMAEILRMEWRLKAALNTYLEVCYLDLNGPKNRESIKDDPEALKQFPTFDPKQGLLAPYVVERVFQLARKLQLGKNGVKCLFVEHNNKIGENLNLPLSPEGCWPLLEKEIEESLE